ncbi:chemotaxis protein CheA [Desulfovibrio gilichinskyi]|uniref:Chemotaxis protein CheA n=1 Tax=Desulfovibrio gilichinskyi TaxID=1519643 RepID=A0A1X7EYD4_9BACT|nr:chemotaxis protein CheA [Desulfovibrio gilichinskyi]SMF42100.1 two-component system, chemotaxis family, sensor kinase CheA [Desulfovibrio gilichinskyi]
MSQDFLDPEIFADFIIEAKEHLETIEPNLLELENNPDNLDILNEIFRPMHSLKGASGFLGLNIINGLAHRAENVLDELRKGEIAVNSEIMDVILAATDSLRQLIDNLDENGNEGNVDTSIVIERIEAIMAGETLAPPEIEDIPEPEIIPEPEPEPEPEESELVSDLEQDEIEPELPEVEMVQEPTTPESSDRKQSYQFVAIVNENEEPYRLTTVGEGHLADFLEEAHEIIENLTRGLLELEQDPEGNDDLINDIFRYFHNLKGNSGIIGFRELNSLTHEAETLLNKVRKGEINATHYMIDLLLAVVDGIESLIAHVTPSTGEVQPLDIAQLIDPLQDAVERGEVLPVDSSDDAYSDVEEDSGEADESEDELESSGSEDGLDPEDITIFEQTVHQQIDNITLALTTLEDDSSLKDYIDALFRSLVSIQNSAGYMGFASLKEYAERTAGLVDQARSTDMDFGLMIDLLKQECGIIEEMIFAAVAELKGEGESSDSEEAAKAELKPAPKAEPKPAPKAEPKPAPKAEPKPEAKKEPKVAATEKVKPESAPAPKAAAAKPAPKSDSKPATKPAVKAADKIDSQAVAGGTPAVKSSKPKAMTTIRVDHQKLDHLMNLIGELIISRGRYTMLARGLEEGHLEVPIVAQQLTETTYALSRISDDLQDTIMKVRMVAVQTVFSRFPRLVRDLSRKSNKRVELITEGEETELDKSVVEEIGDPLVHLIRNSVDHGLEPEEERLANGKTPEGHVWLRAYHKGNSVAIEVEDDGRGIDPEKMRNVAVKKGVITAEEARSLDDREAIELIFAPGFSSAEKVTDISGRGVGMDVVRNNIKDLKGSVQISSEVGKGSKFTLILPLTLAIIDALMVQINGANYAIPLDAVSETTKIEAERLTEVNNRKVVTLRGEVLGIAELAELLEQPVSDPNREVLPVVIIHDNVRRLGLVVDRLLERQEIVIKPLGNFLSRFDLKGVSGATIMGDGSVVLILDPHEIYSMATVKGSMQ